MNRDLELSYWIKEREAMRLRKEDPETHAAYGGMKYGYSDDPHMGTVRYCNVRREDDKVTRWLAQHWRPQHHTAWELTLARMVNFIPSLEMLERILNEADPGENCLVDVAEAMKEERDNGAKIWTSAYTISTCGKSMDKVDYVMGVVDAVRQMEEEKWNKVPAALAHFGMEYPLLLSVMHKNLTTVDGLGSFLAGQVVADMKNTKGHPLQNAEDWGTWSAHGPGSLKGLSAYYQRTITPREYQKAITQCWEEVKPHLPTSLHDLHMQDFQNCLCEFSKYSRVKVGGHARNRYVAS